MQAAPRLQIIMTSQQECQLPANLRVFKWQVPGWSRQQAAESISHSGIQARAGAVNSLGLRIISDINII